MKRIWKQSRDGKKGSTGAPGADAQTAESFQLSIDQNIKRLRQEIQRSNFTFYRLRGAPVAKATGGFRIIAVPTVRDRLLQRCLLSHLENDPKFPSSSPISYGFEKGKTLKDAQIKILEHRKHYPWVLQVDIIKFFDRIPRADVKRLVRRKVKSKVVSDLLCAAIDCEIDERIPRIEILARENGIQRGVGLRQGMPVSPMLSNLLLREFDREIAKRRIPAVRYADDIALFARSKSECRDHFDLIVELLFSLKLNVSKIEDKKKTVMTPPEGTLSILGVDVKYSGSEYKIYAPSNRLDKIKKEMISISSLEECIKNRCDLVKLSRLLESFVIGHAASLAVVSDHREFLNRLEAEKERCITNFLSEVIGADAVAKLDRNKRAVLGLGTFS